jgi:SRSO17 transposase
VLVDRELYVPRSWTGDRDRCDEAGISEDVAFATKPQLARTMVEPARELGLPFAWFTADEAYGDNGKLREWLEKEGICHVVAVARDTTVPAGAGRTIRVGQLAARVPGKGGSGCPAGTVPRASGCTTGRSRSASRPPRTRPRSATAR